MVNAWDRLCVGDKCAHMLQLSQAVPAAMPPVGRRHMRTRLNKFSPRFFLFLHVPFFALVGGLRRSGLSMGSILVCLAGTPASVAVEGDARVLVSVAEIAFVRCLWSAGATTWLSAGPPLCGGFALASLWHCAPCAPTN